MRILVKEFIKKGSSSGIILIFITLLALFLRNSPFSVYYVNILQTPIQVSVGELLELKKPLLLWINDGLMALFFLLIGLEIKRELLGGHLSSLSKIALPGLAAIGGMLFPALIFIAFNYDDPFALKGWAIPTATDIAFALGILMLLGKRVNPAIKLFLVALAVVDDLGAVLVVAVVYTNEINAIYFLHAGLTYALLWIFNLAGVKKLGPYLILGIFLWVFIHSIGIHATIAGVLLAFVIPIHGKIDEKSFIGNIQYSLKEFERTSNAQQTLSHDQIDALENIAYNYDNVQNPLVKLEHNLHNFSAFFIMPLFAFSNAGVVIDMSTISTHFMIVLGVVLGLLIGKPIGVVGLTYLAVKFKWVAKPSEISWSDIVAVGFLAGIGFTMSIFITHLAFEDESLIAAVKLGVFFASFIAAAIGVILIMISAKKRRA